ncbi:MAG: hypothetical protein KAW41_00790 [Candidatus Diapherotrites archaeon]|nr:hypothetical protein [Candidatus Diapherotrites archaeon]
MRPILAVLLAAMLVGCLTPPTADINAGLGGADDKRMCTIDADCVAEQCCHPTSSVNTLNAPNCTDVACTLDCRPNTVDCGQGYFACASGQCVVMFYPS